MNKKKRKMKKRIKDYDTVIVSALFILVSVVIN